MLASWGRLMGEGMRQRVWDINHSLSPVPVLSSNPIIVALVRPASASETFRDCHCETLGMVHVAAHFDPRVRPVNHRRWALLPEPRRAIEAYEMFLADEPDGAYLGE